MSTIRVVCGWIMDEQGRILLVRKRDTALFLFPGGKPEPGETPRETLAREIMEELGCAMAPPPDRAWPGAMLRAPAANETGSTVLADILPIGLRRTPRVRAEIEDMAWIDRNGRDDRGRVLPCAALTAIAWAAYDGWIASLKSTASRA